VAILITDPNHALPVQINRSGLRSIAVGTGALNRLELPDIANNADVRVGDLLVTAGMGGHFPADYPVGVVAGMRQDPGRPFAQVIATPAAHLDRSREVLLVWPAVRPPALPAAPAPLGNAPPAVPAAGPAAPPDAPAGTASSEAPAAPGSTSGAPAATGAPTEAAAPADTAPAAGQPSPPQ
jgi:rod shape-determining protein MreC